MDRPSWFIPLTAGITALGAVAVGGWLLLGTGDRETAARDTDVEVAIRRTADDEGAGPPAAETEAARSDDPASSDEGPAATPDDVSEQDLAARADAAADAAEDAPPDAADDAPPDTAAASRVGDASDDDPSPAAADRDPDPSRLAAAEPETDAEAPGDTSNEPTAPSPTDRDDTAARPVAGAPVGTRDASSERTARTATDRGPRPNRPDRLAAVPAPDDAADASDASQESPQPTAADSEPQGRGEQDSLAAGSAMDGQEDVPDPANDGPKPTASDREAQSAQDTDPSARDAGADGSPEGDEGMGEGTPPAGADVEAAGGGSAAETAQLTAGRRGSANQDREPATPSADVPPPDLEALACADDPAATLGCDLAAEAIRLVSAAGASGLTVRLNQPDGGYRDQDFLLVEAEVPADFGGFLYLDVLTDAGTVHHLLPEELAPDNAVAPGSTVRTGLEHGDQALGVRSWQVRRPFGRGYVLAVLSANRLYEGTRPTTETIDEYRAALLPALADGGRTSIGVVPLEFRPR